MSDAPGTLDGLSPARRLLLQRLLQEKAAARAGSAAPAIRPRATDGPLPLSPAQRRMWLLDRMEPGSPAYNVPTFLRMRGALEPGALVRAVAALVNRHESLRTVFPERGGEPVQEIRPAGSFPVPVADLRGVAEADRERLLRGLLLAEGMRPFDLERGPIMRAGLLRLADDDSVLLVNTHHIVSDEWSVGVMVREVSAMSDAFARGEPSPLPEPEIQFADYALWQREMLAGGALEAQLAFWRDELGDAPLLLELPTDRPRGAAPGTEGHVVSFGLPPETALAVRALARAEGATLFMTLLAAWQALLARWSGQDDVSVGTPVAGRERREAEGLVGYLANTLVLRADLSDDPTGRALLARVRETVLEAHANQDVPFERLVEELAPERSLSHSPLFQVMFSVETYHGKGGMLGSLATTEMLGVGAGIPKFDLTLIMTDLGEAIQGRASARAELFDADTLVRLRARWVALTAGMAADPDRPLSAIPLLDDAERRMLLAWSATGAADPVPLPLHETFAAQAARRPHAAALVFGDEVVGYDELDRRSAALARRLAALGVGPEVCVGVCMERSPAMVAGLLAVLRAGGAYVAMDPQHPDERLAFMLADTRAPVLLTEPGLAGRFANFGGEVVLEEGEPDTAHIDAPEPVVSPENLAYVIYTSGSTGTPKGTAVPHRAIPGFFRGADYARWDEEQVLLQHSSVSWDVLTLELWPALLTGGTCVLYPGRTSEPATLGEQVRAHGVTTLWLTSAYFNVVVDTAPEVLAGVRQLLVGGEAVSAAHVRRALELHPGLRLVNGYGPSECTVFSTAYVVPPGFAGASVPIGTPAGDRRVYLLDRRLEPVPVGVPGELYVGGPAVARGYLGRPRLTAEKFVPDPFGGEAGARLYRSGDRARWRADGTLEFVGRTDFQVKVRGFRVEPGEVEAALASHPAVRQAVVVVREAAPGDRRLVGYVTARPGASLAPAELRSWLGGRLPEYMVPGALVVLDAMPLTPRGKIDRRALPAPDAYGEAAAHVAPRTQTEEVLAGVWAEVLGVDRVGAADDFFALGGHSLLATRVASRLREAFGVEVPLRAVFEAPVLADLALRVDELLREGAGVRVPPVAPVPRDAPLPLSFGQRRLWVVDQLQPGSPAYNVPTALRVRGPLRPRALARALAALAERHEALRTVLPASGGEPVQVVLPPAPVPLPVVDLGSLPADRAGREALRLAGEEAMRPFDLGAGPLLRSTLLHLGDEDRVVLFTLHHAVSDGWSVGVLTREVSELYAAAVEGRAPALDPLPVQYADYAAWQHRWMSGETLDAQIAWWSGRLEGAPPLLELPTDRPRPAHPDGRGAAVRVELPADLSERVRAWARRRGATPFMALLAAWQALLARWSGLDDVIVGTPVAGRDRREVEGLIGFFVNTLALRARVPAGESFDGLLGRVREEVLGAFAHQDFPFERLVEVLAPDRAAGSTPIYQAIFALQTADAGELSLGGARVEPFGGGAAAAKYDLAMELTDVGGRFAGGIVFRTELFDADTAGRLAERYAALLEGALADPGRRLAEIPLLAPGERRVLVAEWGAPGALPAPAHTVPELFAAQAARTPDAAALSFGGATTTYAELDRRSAALARELAARGVGPDARVGLCAERSAEMVVGMLAILRAGGAYLPLDPEYPAERLAFMLADAGARVLLTDGAAGNRLADFAGEVVALETPLPPTPSPARGEGEHDGVENPGAVSHSRTFALSDSQLAYVIYTSGSTGTPKGVAVPHRGIVRLVRGADFAQLGPGDRVAQLANPVFDAATWEIWGALLNGGCVVGIDRESVLDPRELAATLREERVTGAFLTATLFNQTVREVPDAFATVTHLLVGGEALDPPSLRACLAGGPPRRLVNGYGPTENTTFSTWHAIDRVAEDAWTVPIGRPVAGSTAYVLDPAMEPAPVGWPGELCVGGPGVARGYLERPEATAERFVPDPFAAEPGARLYRTGDRARWSARGEIEFLGRIDQQVKVRGFRIEPGEVEAALAAHPAVREAAVVVRGEGADRRLVGFVTVAEGEPAGGAGLRAWLAERLPEYMVPAVVAVLDTLPLTPGGKLDRQALPEVEAGEDAGAWVAPRTPMEEILAGIWGAVLDVERVGAHGNFFELGGHSLLATIAISRVSGAFGVELPLRTLFEAPTVAQMAERVAEARRAGVAPPPPILPVPRTSDVPVSFAQRRLWLIDRLEPGTTAWNMPFPLRLRGALDVGALERALAELVRRHESLRTVFPDVDGEPVQRILPAGPRPLPVVDLRALPEGAREAAARRLAGEEASRPFELARGPLLRSVLLRTADDDWALLLTLHHIVSDGWSMQVLLREVSALYRAGARGRPSPLPALPAQYADYAAWQRGWLAGETLEAQLAFWRGALAGAPPLLELPAARPRPTVQRHRGASRALHLPAGLSDAVRALGREEGTTPFMTLLAAFAALLARYTGETDVVVGTPIAGRNRPETEGMIGYFLNTLALRTDVGGDPTFRELLGRVREATLGAYAHQDLPFEQLLEELAPARSLSHAPVFQVMFNFLNFADGGPPALPGVEMEMLGGGQAPARYDWNLYARETAGGIGLELVYDADLFEDARMGEALAHLAALLEAVVKRPGLRVSDLPLAAPEAPRASGLPEDGRPFHPWAEDAAEQTIPARFAAQARLHPDRLAVRTRRHSLTYAELDAAAARAAAALLRASPGAGERAALLFGHDAPMLVGILGALKAGRAYVPLDPGHPRERSAGVLDDSGAAVLLADAEHAPQARELAGGRVPVVVLDDGAPEDGAPPLPRPASPDDLAYLLYTSGSTGRPKGVAQSHRNVLHFIRAYTHNLRIGPDDVLTLFSSYTFDAAVMAIWGALLNGASLRPFDWRAEPAGGAAEWMRREGITLYHSTPTVFRHLAGGLGGDDVLPAVRVVVLGGEEAQRRDWEAFRRHFPAGAVLVNGLGPTESTVTLQAFLDHERGPRGAVLPVGLPVRDTGVLLVNAAGEQPAVYGAGEIVVRGAHLALGYWGRPELTAAAFVPDPAGGPLRAYRTGDLGRRLPDGSLEFLGRTDFQVKVRGVRVEPGEVEAALRAHPAVREVVVAPRADASGERRLVAWLVPAAPGGAPAPAELRGWARERVPEHMVPAAFVAVEALPLTSTGKVDRLALPDPEPAEARGYTAPRGVIEEMLAGIFAEVLKVERVGIHDDFFALGGHSLLATQVVARVRTAMGVELPLRALFEAPSVAELAERALAAAPAAVVDDLQVDEEMAKLAALSDEEVMRLLRATES